MNKIYKTCEQCDDTGEYSTTIINHKGERKQEMKSCQVCCAHGDWDHGICGICGSDEYENLCGAAEAAYEGNR